MGLGWFGYSTFWLLPLAWRLIARSARALSGERKLAGPGTLRVWLGTALTLCASASLEALTAVGADGGIETASGAGGGAGAALAQSASALLGWTGALVIMLGVLALAAPMVFGETWRSLFAAHPGRQAARPAPRERGDAMGDKPAPTPRPQPEANWEPSTTRWTPVDEHGVARSGTRHKGIEAISARRAPVWQPPPRTRMSPVQPGEIWVNGASATAGPSAATAAPPTSRAAHAAAAVAAPSTATRSTLPTRGTSTPPPQKPPLRGTIVSSPFRQPQLGLRDAGPRDSSGVTTDKPQHAAPRTSGHVPASASAPVAAMTEGLSPAMTTATVHQAGVADQSEVATRQGETGEIQMPSSLSYDDIRAEAQALLAELRALAGRETAATPTEGPDLTDTPLAPASPIETEPLTIARSVAGTLSEPVPEAPEPVEAQAEPASVTPSASDGAVLADSQNPHDAGPSTGQASTAPAKPRIVVPAVVGRAVPLAGASAHGPQVAVTSGAPLPAIATATAAPVAPPRIVDYRLPAVALLEPAADHAEQVPEQVLAQTGELIAQRLAEFKVPVAVVGASAGPVITRFEVEPAMGVRGAQVVNLMKDLARALGVSSIRVVETIPGKTCMGLELPNARREMIRLSEIVEAAPFQNHASHLVLAMGKDITGNPVVTDLARAPHLLVAGTTGSGKSVAINAMILSMLYKATPDDVRMIMIDPKMLELSVYEGIPHLLAPVVTDMKQAAHALNWCVGEMEKRYRLMSALGVRNLAGYNQKIRAAEAAGNKVANPFSLTPEAPEPLSTLPLIVVVIDELADLMMVAGKKIEELIARLAQKARAAGIHLILATQRPSVDVITGLIKANIPTRVAFQVSSKIDSRTILDQMGAESLLGQGDMLFLPPGTGYPQRVHGAFASDDEVHRVVEHWKQFGEPDYDDAILAGDAPEASASGGDLFGDGPGGDAESDPLYDEAVAFVINSRRASISAVQRHLRIGYNRSARLLEQMEVAGLVSPMGRNGMRDVLAPGGSE